MTRREAARLRDGELLPQAAAYVRGIRGETRIIQEAKPAEFGSEWEGWKRWMEDSITSKRAGLNVIVLEMERRAS